MWAGKGGLALSRRFSPWLLAAAGGMLLAAGLGVVLSSPMRATSRSARANIDAPGARHARDRVSREAFFLNRRGLNFGIPRGAYRKAIARMHQQERDAAANSTLDASGLKAPAALFAWNALGPLLLLNEIPAFGGVAM